MNWEKRVRKIDGADLIVKLTRYYPVYVEIEIRESSN